MNAQKWRPEPSLSDICANCKHERRDHQGKRNAGSCAKCWDVRSKWAQHCQRFRKYARPEPASVPLTPAQQAMYDDPDGEIEGADYR